MPRTPGREASFTAYRQREGRGLTDFATWCALAEDYGPDFARWPAELHDPESPAVADYAAQHTQRIDFHCWLQWLLDEQLASAHQAGLRAGMAVGVMHDLAVGVSRHGADAWGLQSTYATGITVGAPPDPYNQNGQDWNQPPWRPDRLAATAYAPFRELVSTILRHAGGIRVDHVIGLFRLWWIPAGAGPTQGTYIRYDHEAMVGILALEAHRAAALVVGEDLGTVEPWVRDYLRERGILGTSILWFEFDWDGDGSPLAPEKWRKYCLASVTTHDLPPTPAYLAGDHVRLRDRLGILTRSLTEELAVDETERQAWLDNLRHRGLLLDDAGEQETIHALHRYLTLTPSRLLCVALTDAVGDREAQNQPGTVDEYPNWRVPLTGPDGCRDAAGGRPEQRAGGGARRRDGQRGPPPRVDHALLDGLGHGVGLGLGQRPVRHGGVEPGLQCRRPLRLSGRPDLLEGGGDLGLVDAEFLSQGFGQGRVTLRRVRRGGLVVGLCGRSVLLPVGPQRLGDLVLAHAQLAGQLGSAKSASRKP